MADPSSLVSRGSSADTSCAVAVRTDGGRDTDREDEFPDATGVVDGDTREVVVPDRLYKTVTVFTTLFAVVAVLAGFVALDLATNRAQAPLSEVDPVFAIAGLGSILLGAAVYAFSTRFRAAGMENAKDDTDEPSHNG